jgi:hypothetical protein
MSVSTPPATVARAISIVAVCLWVLDGCTPASRKNSPSPEAAPREAGTLLGELAGLFEAGKFEAADSFAREILTVYPGFPQADEVLLIASRASSAPVGSGTRRRRLPA